MNPSGLAIGNFDADSVDDPGVDLIVTDRAAGTVRWLEGKGTGAFLVRAPIQVGAEPVAVTVSDFDADGLADVATSNAGDGTLSVLFGRGDGSFDPPLTTEVAGEPRGLAASGSFIGVADAASASVVIVEVAGDRSVNVLDLVPVGVQPSAVVAGDVTGDGLDDFLVANQGSNSVSVLRASRARIFVPILTLAMGRSPSALALGDVDGDGQLDLAVAESNDNTLSVWRGDGLGGFARVSVIPVGVAPAAVVIADDRVQRVSGDGNADILVANAGSSDVTVLRGDGSGAFTGTARLLVGSGPTALVLGRFDNDSDGTLDVNADIAVANALSGDVAVARGQGGGSFIAALNFAVDGRPVAVTAADFLKDDGRIDLLVANGGGDTLSLLEGNGRGSLRAPITVAAGQEPIAVTSGDFDGNGIPDAVVAYAAREAVLLHRGDPAGRFAAFTSVDVGGLVGRLITVDVNDDGRSDVVMTQPQASRLAVLVNSGPSFAAPGFVDVGARPAAVTPGAILSEGQIDLVVALTDPSGVGVVPGNGDGSFEETIVTDLDEDPLDLTVADFDEDGERDVAVVGAQSGTIRILPGTGDGTFVPAVELEGPTGPVNLAAADLNGDEHADLVVLGADDVVVVFAGNGNGSFQEPGRFAVGRQPAGMLLTDLNNDRLPDVVVVNEAGETVTVLRNTTQVVLPPVTPAGTVSPTPAQSPAPTRVATSASAGGGGSSGGGCHVSAGEPGATAWLLMAVGLALALLRRYRV